MGFPAIAPAPTLAPFPGISPGLGASPANNIVPFRGGPAPLTPNWASPPLKGLPPAPIGAGTAAGAGAGAIAGTVAAGAAIGIGTGELLRREGLRQGLDGLAYPSNTPELLRDPLGTLRDGARGTRDALQDAFGPDDLAGQPAPIPLSPSNAPAPFTGGQSPGITYLFDYEYSYLKDASDPSKGRVTSSGTSSTRGPIKGLRVTTIGTSPNTAKRFSFIGTNANGSERENLILQSGTQQDPKASVSNIRRADGQPDTGGDPAAEPNREPSRPQSPLRPIPALIPLSPPSPALAPKPLSPPAPSPSPSLPGDPLPGNAPTPRPIPGAAPSPGGLPKPAPAPRPAPSADPGTDPGADPGADPENKPDEKPEDICESPCIQDLGAAAEKADGNLKEILKLLKEIHKTLGVKSFPLSNPLLTGERGETQKDIIEILEWIVKNIDAVNGYWPLDVKVLGADSKTKTIKIKDMSSAINELFGLLFTIAEDADAAVNIGARNIAETIQTKISTIQSGQLLKAIQKFLGFNTKATKDQIKLSVSPKASGADNKLQNQEMADFLRPSKQLFTGVEYSDNKELIVLLERILEDAEIARAALFKPLRINKKGESTLTGEALRREKLKSGIDIYEEEWESFIASLRRRDVKLDEKKPGKNE